MRKNYKRLTAMLMTSAIALSAGMTAMTAYAEDASTYTITVDSTNADEATHIYKVYQIFAADVTNESNTDVVSNVKKGSNITNLNDFITKLKTKDSFKDCETLNDVLNVLKGKAKDSKEAMEFAEIAKANLNGDPVASGSGTFDNLEGGYYLIVEDDTSKLNKDRAAYSRPMLTVIGPNTNEAIAKKDVPSIDKKIGTDYSSGKGTATASIGDKIPYVLKSAVPDMTGYNRYYFVIKDTMESGLTFNNDVKITIDGKTVPTENYTVTKNNDDNSFKIVMKDFYKNYYELGDADTSNDGSLTGKDIIVNYSATLNKNAELYSNSNDNAVDLTFSNNPNFDYDGNKIPGKPDEPPTDSDYPENPDKIAPTGKTPEIITKTYTSGIQIKKVDGSNGNAPLAGVKFRLSGKGLKTTKVNGSYYRVSDTGTYWQLKDGTYTNTDPTGDGVDSSKYVSTTDKYELVTVDESHSAPDCVETEFVTPANGIISFKGLAPGEYTLTEVEPKAGYNAIDPITITITDSKDENNEILGTGWTATASNVTGNLSQDETTKCFEFEVVNNKGVTLPGTGGIGTALFYTAGTLLIAGGATLLITKKRMNVKEK